MAKSHDPLVHPTSGQKPGQARGIWPGGLTQPADTGFPQPGVTGPLGQPGRYGGKKPPESAGDGGTGLPQTLMGWIATVFYSLTVPVAVAYVTAYAYDALSITWGSAYLVGINVVAFVLYAYDKILVDLLNFLQMRVPESVLIWQLAFPGGTAGTLLSMALTGHKTGEGGRAFRRELGGALFPQMFIIIGLLVISQAGFKLPIQLLDDLVEFVVLLVLDLAQAGLALIQRLIS